MIEQLRTSKSRAYRKRRRAVSEDETRRRIVEAAVQLHGSQGPARTTIAMVAESAGVTRATVYRHFPDAEALFGACSAHWYASLRHRPNPDSWLPVVDPFDRLRVGLRDLYAYYREAEPMLSRVQRDAEAVPETVRRAGEENAQRQKDVLLSAFAGRRRSKTLAAVVAHAAAFGTWRSLCVDGALSERAAIELMSTLVRAAAGATRPRVGSPG